MAGVWPGLAVRFSDARHKDVSRGLALFTGMTGQLLIIGGDIMFNKSKNPDSPVEPVAGLGRF
jgi:hypothetical protein